MYDEGGFVIYFKAVSGGIKNPVSTPRTLRLYEIDESRETTTPAQRENPVSDSTI